MLLGEAEAIGLLEGQAQKDVGGEEEECDNHEPLRQGEKRKDARDQ